MRLQVKNIVEEPCSPGCPSLPLSAQVPLSKPSHQAHKPGCGDSDGA